MSVQVYIVLWSMLCDIIKRQIYFLLITISLNFIQWGQFFSLPLDEKVTAGPRLSVSSQVKGGQGDNGMGLTLG